jgi:hypothetical protein
MPTIGVIADTHVPQRMDSLPREIRSVFRGVDLILHAGDLNQAWVLRELETLAPTLAVRGNADVFNRDLPYRRVVKFGGKRIGLIHGHGGWLRYLWRKIADAFEYNGDVYTLAARAAFEREPVDAIIFGHTHRPCCYVVDGALMFNPGPVAPTYHMTRGPQVGLLHVETGGLRSLRSLRSEIIEV